MRILILFTTVFFAFIGSCQSNQLKLNDLAFLHDQSIEGCRDYFSDYHFNVSKNWYERMIIYDEKDMTEAKTKLAQNIDSFKGRNKCNLEYNYNYNSLIDFNPFMYHLSFESSEEMIYYIPNLNFYLIILPK